MRRATSSERALWALIRDRRLGVEFRREIPLGRFTVDFYCAHLALAVEVDGEYHDDRAAYDAYRDADLGERGIRTLRITKREVLEAPTAARDRVAEAIRTRRAEIAGNSRRSRWPGGRITSEPIR